MAEWDFGPLDAGDDIWGPGPDDFSHLFDDHDHDHDHDGAFLVRDDGFWDSGAASSYVVPPSTVFRPPPPPAARPSHPHPLPLPHVETSAALSSPPRQHPYVQDVPAANQPPHHRPQPTNNQQPNTFGYTVFDGLDEEDSASESSSEGDFQHFVILEDSDDDAQEGMAPTTRRRGAAAAASRRQSVVDLTAGSTPPEALTRPPRGRKRSVDTTNSGEGRAAKRQRPVPEDIEEIDLVDEAPSVEEKLLTAQQQEAIKAQQAAQESAIPVRIGQRSCIICMENYTNCTATACGHFYCHECLIQALMAGARNSDRGTGSCPVCRKPLSHTAKKKTDIIPISFMTKKHYDKQQRKGMA